MMWPKTWPEEARMRKACHGPLTAEVALLHVAREKINDLWNDYVKGHNPKECFGTYDCVRFDTFRLDK